MLALKSTLTAIFRYIVYRLKYVGALEIEFVAPILEQIATTTMHFFNVSGGAILKV